LPTSKRNIKFFLIVDELGEIFEDEFPLVSVGEQIEEIPEADSYIELRTMTVLGTFYNPPIGSRSYVPMIMVDSIDANPQIRVETHRIMTPLPLGTDQNIAEPTYFSVFPNNVLAVMRNKSSSPMVSTFRDYINKLELPGLSKISIIPLVDKERLIAFQDIKRVKKFTFAVGRDINSAVFEDATGVKSIIDKVRDNFGQVDFEIVLKPSNDPGNNSPGIIKNTINQLLHRDQSVDLLNKASVSYVSEEFGSSLEYDFLREMITMEVNLEPGETGLLSPEAVSREMKHAHRQLLPQIDIALESLTR